MKRHAVKGLLSPDTISPIPTPPLPTHVRNHYYYFLVSLSRLPL